MENIIQRNLFRIVRAGSFGDTTEEIEPMSAFKWQKLCRVVEAQQLVWYFNEGVRACQEQPGCNIPTSLIMNSEPDQRYALHNFRKLSTEIHLDTPILNKRLHAIFNNEMHAIDTSVETLTMLAIITDTINDMLNNGIVLHGVITLGTYLRTKGDKTDFEKLDHWLGKLALRRMAQLQGSILVALFQFTPDEIPFLRRIEPSASRLTLRSLAYTQNDNAHEWHFRQGNAGIIHNNNAALRRNLRRSVCYINYAPIETIGNFVNKFARSLSEIEE